MPDGIAKGQSTSCLRNMDNVQQEIEFGFFRLGGGGERLQRSSSPPAWLSSLSLSLLPMRLFFQFVLKVQYISTVNDTFTTEIERERDNVGINFTCCYSPYDFWLTSTSEHPCCLSSCFTVGNHYIMILFWSVIRRHWSVSSSTIFCKTFFTQCS